MAISAVVWSQRPGRGGECNAAVTVASLQFIPTNILMPLAVYELVAF